MASCSDYLCEFEAKFAMFMGLETDESYFQEKFKRRKIFQHSSLKETHEVKLFFERPESNRLQKFSLSLSLKKTHHTNMKHRSFCFRMFCIQKYTIGKLKGTAWRDSCFSSNLKFRKIDAP
jgi:hypothetical protein